MKLLRKVLRINQDFNEIKDYYNAIAKTTNINCKTDKEVYYYELIGAFDIETSSIIQNDEKMGFMYEWTFGLGDLIIIGRTWKEFLKLYKTITSAFTLNEYIRLIIFIHNLSFEYQFLRKRFKWFKVFANEMRKPIYAVTDDFIEFRCSYLLSGYSLEKLADNLLWHDIKKLKGDLDYTLVRHYKTPLTNEELQYCINDVEILLDYGDELRKRFKIVANIPYTKTGIVRNHIRQLCFKNYKQYKAFIHSLNLTPEVYRLSREAFCGGFTHANIDKVGAIHENVGSFDIASSYPYSILSEKYPMSSGEKIEINSYHELIENIAKYGLIFQVRFFGIRQKVYYDNYISISKCIEIENAIVNNGRLMSADVIGLTITEQDFLIIKNMYEWDEMQIGTCYRFKMNYLPRPILMGVLELYGDKTTLKGVKGKEAEYQNSKEMLNAIYGMMVMDVVRDEIGYDDNWFIETGISSQDQIDKYNKSIRRFLFYLWGVYITAYSRVNLHIPMYNIGINGDYIYSDTDSLKITNPERYFSYFEDLNKQKDEKLKRMCLARKIDFALTRPKTAKGVEKPIGYFEYEGKSEYFKTLGAKRYMNVKDDILHLTISGVNKHTAEPKLMEKYNTPLNVLKNFTDGLFFDEEMTGKLTHIYIDYPITKNVTDYLGKTAEVSEETGVHLEKTTYDLTMTSAFIRLLMERGNYERKERKD